MKDNTTKKTSYNWNIHCVSEGTEFKEYRCDAHTHGISQYKNSGGLELQFTLNMGIPFTGRLLNAVGEKIRDGLVITNGMYIDGIFANYPVKIVKSLDSEMMPVWRLIIPDENGKFDKASNIHPYDLQLENPYINM